jgi:hypothetical protein
MKNKNKASGAKENPNKGFGRRAVSAIAGGIMLAGCGFQQDAYPDNQSSENARKVIESVLPGSGSPVENGDVLNIEQTIEKAIPLSVQDAFNRVGLLEGGGVMKPYGYKPGDQALHFEDLGVDGGYDRYRVMTFVTPSDGGEQEDLSAKALTVESLSILYDQRTGQPSRMIFSVEGEELRPSPDDEKRYLDLVQGVELDLKNNAVLVSLRSGNLVSFTGGKLNNALDDPDEVAMGFEAVEDFLDRAEDYKKSLETE